MTFRQALKEIHDAKGTHLTESGQINGASYVVEATGQSQNPRIQRVCWCGAANKILEQDRQ